MPFSYETRKHSPDSQQTSPSQRLQDALQPPLPTDVISEILPQLQQISPPAPQNLHPIADNIITNTPGVTNRAELIERIKAGESPTWIPNRNISDRYYPNHTPCNAPRLIDEHPDRPHSALHQGIFTNEGRISQPPPSTPPQATPSPFSLGEKYRRFSSATSPPKLPPLATSPHPARTTHSRAPSLSSSFVFKTPTSPLVHSSNPDLDTEGSSDESTPRPTSSGPIDISFSDRRARRKSLPPHALSSLQFSPNVPTLPRHQTFGAPTNARNQWNEPPSPSSARQIRRLSGIGLGTELPPGAFVGSYEESILNGRMSTTPSKPLNFLAQIGVLGLGKCKQSLRCPTHVTLPFPAYFYSVGDYDSPSPYVGQIDLDAALGSESTKSSKKSVPGIGGSYRIPQRGQMQIVIKNPNKTAVKLFLVQYDLRDMEPGTKTFIRQKAFSVAGADDLPVRQLRREKEKDSLRYLIHLHIVCPSRGRYYLFKTIRVVFANRVPDGKERLRNEVLWPEPKYTPWKPESCASTPASSVGGRKRSASLYGTMNGGGGIRAGTPPPLPLPISIPKIFPPTPASNMEVDLPSGDNNGSSSDYEKMDISSSMKRAEGHGLLARRLKQLEVEGEVQTTKDECEDNL
ncbi:hypothetical protein EDC01DRAFT_238727 [Geopyxis carbonaria]|nr:hypothetical protein EDC01DRAFT_238727 [Geopyxis carbonaria]